MGAGRRSRFGVRARAGLAAVLLAALPAALAAVLEEHVQRPYPVHARPDESLRQALQAATPIVENGRRFHGYTRWTVRWTYRWWRESDGRCRITDVTVRLRSEVQLPELRTASPAQRAVFERYLRALSRHEDGHVQFGRDAAQAIDQGIAALPVAPDCPTLERQANALGQRLLDDHVARERQYDQTTGHGVSQGARLDD